MDVSYIFIPLIALGAAAMGSYFAVRDIHIWYTVIKKPSWTPPNWTFGVVWSVLYVLGALSALIVWTATPRGTLFWVTILAFGLNVVLNAAWTYIFFREHDLRTAFYEAIALDISIVVLMVFTWPVAPIATYCLVPYFLWVTFAVLLTHKVWELNK